MLVEHLGEVILVKESQFICNLLHTLVGKVQFLASLLDLQLIEIIHQGKAGLLPELLTEPAGRSI